MNSKENEQKKKALSPEELEEITGGLDCDMTIGEQLIEEKKLDIPQAGIPVRYPPR
ncbi:MAG: hypothetical protein IJ123_00945 [Blautia sp.]|nr:hypothetical protein [Blautia sp.]